MCLIPYGLFRCWAAQFLKVTDFFMKKAVMLYVKGLAMGAADVVPGVSGGTIAFISGIYEELLRSIGNVAPALLLLLKGRVADAWKLANANFLLVLLAGIGTSILTLAKLITYLLETHPIPVWSFFFGLVLVSVYIVGREIKRWNLGLFVLFALGAAFGYWITSASPIHWSDSLLGLFFAGAIAICAMILPGISGSFVLVLMGLYPTVLGALKDFNLPVIVVFASGCAVGLISFARVVSWLLQRWHSITLAFLAGLMLGSLNKIWPWKFVASVEITSTTQSVPAVEINMWPSEWATVMGQNSQWILALSLAFSGVALVLALEWIARRRQVSERSM